MAASACVYAMTVWVTEADGTQRPTDAPCGSGGQPFPFLELALWIGSAQQYRKRQYRLLQAEGPRIEYGYFATIYEPWLVDPTCTTAQAKAGWLTRRSKAA